MMVHKTPFAASGFRPFFLLAGWFSALAIVIWALVLNGEVTVTGPGGVFAWHGHEMAIAYPGAVVAGFLLTAVRNWTGRPTLSGWPLLALAGIWLLPRITTPLLSASVDTLWWTTAVIDALFFPLLSIAVARPIIATHNRRNMGFLLLLSTLSATNIWFHLQAAGIVSASTVTPAWIALDVFALMITLIGGRVIPLFTRNALRKAAMRTKTPAFAPRMVTPWDRRGLWFTVAALVWTEIGAPLGAPPAIAGALLVGAGAINGFRLRGWGGWRGRRDPIVWILHVAWGWLSVAFLLRGANLLWPELPAGMGLHAMTAGAIGVMTLGFMSRVCLGHTGRNIHAPRLIVASYWLVNGAALMRVLTYLLPGDLQRWGWTVSATLWIAAFTLFAVVNTPILLSPRPDGRPG